MSELGPTITELEPTATERLRALLTERGVEWRGGLPTETMVGADGLDLLYVALPDGRVRAVIRNYLTPEQAIAATLGDADATSERQRDAVEVVRCRDCKYGHITFNGKSCKWCDLIATHDPDGCEPYNGYDPEPYFDADFFCAWGERRED